MIANHTIQDISFDKETMSLKIDGRHKSIHILQPLQADTQTKVAKRVCFLPTRKEFQNFSFHPSEKN